jgi:hypothetical protein
MGTIKEILISAALTVVLIAIGILIAELLIIVAGV